jgi:hypothetical protein
LPCGNRESETLRDLAEGDGYGIMRACDIERRMA